MYFILFYFILVDNENALCSFYQFIYSYREEKELDIPEFDSQTAIDAAEEIMNIKNTISS